MLAQSTVRDILRSKGTDTSEEASGERVFSASPDESVFEAIQRMAANNIGALLVLEGSQIVGTITERDYSRKVALQNKTSRSTRVSDIMHREVLYVVPEDSVAGVLALMTKKRVRHFPVMENGNLIGLISMGDVVMTVISDQEFMLDQMARYISNTNAAQTPWLEDHAQVEQRAI